jgi:peptide/nickel transport system substrate-binding protein
MHGVRRPVHGRHRRRSAVLATLVLAAAASACGSGNSGGSGPPVNGGKLVYAVNAEPAVLDPHQSPQDVAALFTRPVLDSLVSLDAQGRVQPWLATSWQVSPDQKTYTFKLRKDVKFSDGTPFDAAAVKANLDHVADPKTKSQLAARLIAPYAGTTVVDPHTAKVTLSRPHSPFLTSLSTAYLGMESPASLKGGPDALARKVIGSGPFVIDAFVPGKGITYHRNPAYAWGPPGAAHTGPAHLAKLEIETLPEDSVRLGALSSGQVDAIASVPPVDVRLVKSNPRLRLQTRQAPGGNYNYYPNTSSGVFADPRVRQAFRDGIDFTTIVDKLYFGQFQPAAGPIAPSTAGYDRSLQARRRYDPMEAARLLDQAGWTGRDGQGFRTKSGKRLVVRWNFVRARAREQRATLAEQVQAEAKKIGFDVEIRDTTLNDAVPLTTKGAYDLLDFSWERADADALRDLFDSASIATPKAYGQNAARYNDKQVDGWLGDALATTDPDERNALYAKVQERVTDDAVVFPVYVFTYILGSTTKVHGIGWEQQAYPTFYDAWVTKG